MCLSILFLSFLSLADVRLHQIVSTSSNVGVIGSPSRQTYALSNEQSMHHQQTMQRHTDSRLPPDLLAYGQHQSLVLQSSLKNSSSSSTGSSTSTAILDHRIQSTHNGNNSNSNSSGSNRFAFAYTDDRLSENLDDDDDDETDMQQLFVRHTPIEEPDLRIYHNDNVLGKTSKSYAKLNSPSPTISTHSMMSTTNKLPAANPTHRTTNIYELTPASAILNTSYSSSSSSNSRADIGKHYATGKTNPSKTSTLQQMHPKVTKMLDNDSSVNCKPRQSVVRTSPSFSFLSTGYNQQQDNFLWCFGPNMYNFVTVQSKSIFYVTF